MVRHAVILSAGLGTRFLPFTKAIPKPMLPIIDTPAIEYIIKEALESDITNITIVVGANGDVIRRHFSVNKHLDFSKLSAELREKIAFSDNVKINFATQYILDGTAGAILEAREFVEGNPFLVMNADELFVRENASDAPVSKQLITAFEDSNKCVVGVKRVSIPEASRLGVVVGEKIDERRTILRKIVEKPNACDIADPLVNLGRYVVKPDIFPMLENVLPNKNGEKALTDALVDYAKTEDILCYNFVGKRYDIGNKESYMRAVFDFSMLDPHFERFARKRLLLD